MHAWRGAAAASRTDPRQRAFTAITSRPVEVKNPPLRATFHAMCRQFFRVNFVAGCGQAARSTGARPALAAALQLEHGEVTPSRGAQAQEGRAYRSLEQRSGLSILELIVAASI
jgi:hypothetical protein